MIVGARGMKPLKGEVAVVTGADASQLDWIQRHFPERYWRIIGPLLERRAGRPLV